MEKWHALPFLTLFSYNILCLESILELEKVRQLSHMAADFSMCLDSFSIRVFIVDLELTLGDRLTIPNASEKMSLQLCNSLKADPDLLW